MPGSRSVVDATGRGAIAIGVVLFALGVLAAPADASTPLLEEILAMAPPWFPTWPFAHMQLLAGLQAGAGVVTIGAGYALLQGRAWARAVLETLCWVSVAAIVLFVGAWMYQVIRALPRVSDSAAFIVVGTLVALPCVAAHLPAIRRLRSPALREELRRGPAGDTRQR